METQPLNTGEVTQAVSSITIPDSLPLQNMHYTGEIDGLYARMQLQLRYDNKLDHSIEAIFNFPLPSEATVLEVNMKIGERVVKSELRKRADAKAEYEKARDEGHHASLMEEERPNIFTMSVGGIEPGEHIDVSVEYAHPIDWQNSGGRLTLPLVVAPRFIPGIPGGKVAGGWSPDTDAVPDASRITPRVVENVDYTVSGSVKLCPGFEAHMESPSHDMIIKARDIEKDEAVTLAFSDLRPDRDLIVAYRTTSERPQVKVDRTLLLKGESQSPEEFVLVQVVPGLASQPKSSEVILLLDHSGSMEGPAIDGLRVVSGKVVEKLMAHQGGAPLKVGVIEFDNSPNVLQPLSDPREVSNFKEIFGRIQAAGGTEAGKALDYAMNLFSKNPDPAVERSIVIISDGQTESTRFKPRPGVRIHSVGISSAINDSFLKDIARESGGQTYWVYPGEDYDKAAGQIVSFVSGPVVRDIKVEGLTEGSLACGVRDLYASRPSIFAIRSRDFLEGCRVTGIGVDGQPVSFEIPRVAGESSRLGAVLWAKMRLGELKNAPERETLSLEYGILARETAFVAVSLKDVPGQKPQRVDIPVLLPIGWEHEKVFGRIPSMMASMLTRGGHKGLVGRSAAFSGGALRGLDADDEERFMCSIDSIEEIVSFSDESHLCGSMDVDEVIFGPPPSVPDLAYVTSQALLKDATMLLNEIEGGSRSDDTDKRFEEIKKALEREAKGGFHGWSERDKAELFYALAKFRSFGLKADMPNELRARPQSEDAREVWVRGQRELGISVNP